MKTSSAYIKKKLLSENLLSWYIFVIIAWYTLDFYYLSVLGIFTYPKRLSLMGRFVMNSVNTVYFVKMIKVMSPSSTFLKHEEFRFILKSAFLI